MRAIKVMADYQCFPLWEAFPGVGGNIDPKDLPISLSLQQRLTAWAKTFDAMLNIDDPLNSGFRSEQERIEFREEGQLWFNNFRKNWEYAMSSLISCSCTPRAP